ncbi:MAG: serpin family protein [Ruminococcaceae bacterium]|nr:serpin family protein [Oscillospiraceae bacterium]
MKEKKIFDAITDVREELIEEAENSRLNKNRRLWQKTAVLAACVVLVIAVVLLIPGLEKEETKTGPLLDVVYPDVYAFDDGEARMAIRNQNPVDAAFVEAINNFSYKTATLLLQDDGRNKSYAPLSLYFALSLASSGARQDTATELLDVLGVPDTGTMMQQCGNLYRLLYHENKIGKLKIANSLWLDHDYRGQPVHFKDDFVKQAAEHFYASSHHVDFAQPETGKQMAAWIVEHTQGTLNPEIEADPEQILAIINTIYFYDQWVDRFSKEETSEDIFYLADGSEVKSDFMNRTCFSAGFSRGTNFTRAGLALKNAAQMVFVLPDQGVSPYELLASPELTRLTIEGGDEHNGEVIWKIPKFSFGSAFDLKDMLIKLGVNKAFQQDADFSGITDHTAFISRIRQETHIAIDENGVEAAAFTKIDYAGAAQPQGRAEMILDRPFIFAVIAQNGNLLFVGVCENPAQ